MVLTHHTSKITLLFMLVLFTRCGNEQDTEQMKEVGKNYYSKNCLSCHSWSSNTLYQPSLDSMSHYERTRLYSTLNSIKTDSIHKMRLLEPPVIDTLVAYIASYRKMGTTP